ncbi:hypothetical protein T07_7479 [Trichinella nelsoni]|uniref:Uncharacterized protein n=1 Tax=Trichinella nelsoni TaxID=6336 RepID=A0A0V0SD92_9BILA|nr:hypothetical protein T07_7479 [Trichinella nelsoni]
MSLTGSDRDSFSDLMNDYHAEPRILNRGKPVLISRKCYENLLFRGTFNSTLNVKATPIWRRPHVRIPLWVDVLICVSAVSG